MSGGDIFDKQKRSYIMSRIRGKNTACERIVFTYLRQQKVYFQKHYGKVPGSPDIALPRKKKAVFVDGDFWHGRDFALRESKLSKFWNDKIHRNIERDKESDEALYKLGWQVLRIWESNLQRKSTREETLRLIIEFIRNSNGSSDSETSGGL